MTTVTLQEMEMGVVVDSESGSTDMSYRKTVDGMESVPIRLYGESIRKSTVVRNL